MSDSGEHIIPNNSFFTFCETAQRISGARGTLWKRKIFREYITQLECDSDIALAARFIGEGAFSSVSGKRASVGHRTVAVTASEFCEIDYDLVFKPCRTALGSASEAIQKLMANLPVAVEKRSPEYPALDEIEQWYIALANARKRDDKTELLADFFRKLTPIEIKYFIRVMGQGSLRIGFEALSIINSLADAYDKDSEKVRYTHMITGSLEKTAVLCKQDKLDDASFRMFQPLSFMLASPIESSEVEDITRYIAEEKFDGMRCQLHADGEKIALFSRDLNEITQSFPDISSEFSEKNLNQCVLDGEICVYVDQKIQPFQLLQKRMGLKKPSKKILSTHPVVFIGYDVLYANGESQLEKTLTERRSQLKALSDHHRILISSQMHLTENDDVETLFNQALDNGNEGLVLKLKSSTYEYGQRKKSWLKVKKPGGSIDTIMMYAHAGSGKRGGTYSDFTLGVSVKDDPRYNETFIPIGKAYGGYTDDELKKLNREIKKLTVERFGPTLSLKPGIVVEIEFDDIQVNKRTKAGYTLRFPRFRAIRWDLSPDDTDSLKDVEALFEARLRRNAVRQNGEKSVLFPESSEAG